MAYSPVYSVDAAEGGKWGKKKGKVGPFSEDKAKKGQGIEQDTIKEQSPFSEQRNVTLFQFRVAQ